MSVMATLREEHCPPVIILSEHLGTVTQPNSPSNSGNCTTQNSNQTSQSSCPPTNYHPSGTVTFASNISLIGIPSREDSALPPSTEDRYHRHHFQWQTSVDSSTSDESSSENSPLARRRNTPGGDSAAGGSNEVLSGSIGGLLSSCAASPANKNANIRVSPSPFAYRETECFEGDLTRRASVRRTFREEGTEPAGKILEDGAAKSFDEGSNQDKTEVSVYHFPIDLSPNTPGDEPTYVTTNLQYEDGNDWNPSKVTFNQRVEVHEYEQVEVDDCLLNEGVNSGFEVGHTGQEDLDGIADEDESCTGVHAPPDRAYIPLIPNRRLVSGGDFSLELRRYHATKGLSTPSSAAGDQTLRSRDHRTQGFKVGDIINITAPEPK